MWCGYCKNNMHQESICKKKGRLDGIRKVTEEQHYDQDHLFKAKHTKNKGPPDKVKMKGIMVDAGATSHIVNDIGKFESFDDSFQSETHSVELADGTKCNGIAQRRGTAMVCLLDNTGQQHRAQLRDALYMPSYPHDIFSVARATNGGATITFMKGDSHMVTKGGDRAVCDIPQTYQDAIASTKSRQWENAMNEEMRSLEENKTFRLTQLPPELIVLRWGFRPDPVGGVLGQGACVDPSCSTGFTLM
ncbi:hypothetical protein AAFF_G00111580 [Aldrovandia affinis]|uniref:Retrovirus-related Pol polyprotein from transposon TNT 1-94-like beta-barrel domain-containing protein n=1 Tax=Aldrovandia affinis TaxID=143900 RepID=A0AAD7WAJ6_9TELE|nr:hypothetical protein AAFF_G00111580 [Aldrovandia affinis]